MKINKKHVFEVIIFFGFDGEKSQLSTKQIADYFNITTKRVYKFCCELEKEKLLIKAGYRVADGYEDVYYSNHHFNSLTWQINIY